MDFAFTPEQTLLQRTARDVLAASAPMSHVRAMMADARGTTDAVWRQLGELGWLGMIFGEEYGGAGLGMLELAIVLGEMGRVALPSPFLSTIVAGRLLMHGGDESQRRRWLPAICDGSRIATLALLEAEPRWDLEGVTAVARPEPGGFRLAGTKLFVPDAHVADLVVCAVRRADDGEPALVVVDGRAARVTPVPSVDQTRKIFALDLDGVQVSEAELLAGDATAALATTPRRGAGRARRRDGRRRRARARDDRRAREDPPPVRPADRHVPGGAACVRAT